MNYNTMKKSELVELLNERDVMIEALQNYIKSADATIANYEGLMKKLTETAEKAINSAEKSQKIAEGFQAASANAHKIADEAINVAKIATADTKKNAPTPVDSNDDGKKKQTYAEAISDWKIKKYGSIKVADAVAAMTSIVAKEWADTARKTGKYVVSKRNYKNKLYAEAYLRVLIKNKADKKLIAAQKKVVDGLK